MRTTSSSTASPPWAPPSTIAYSFLTRPSATRLCPPLPAPSHSEMKTHLLIRPKSTAQLGLSGDLPSTSSRSGTKGPTWYASIFRPLILCNSIGTTLNFMYWLMGLWIWLTLELGV
ncbi:hypothetical protein GBA52_016486 [Prunus armeniaca]|nr:hypothetical protein GBA52_016486 [Prunus armeniaca]